MPFVFKSNLSQKPCQFHPQEFAVHCHHAGSWDGVPESVLDTKTITLICLSRFYQTKYDHEKESLTEENHGLTKLVDKSSDPWGGTICVHGHQEGKSPACGQGEIPAAKMKSIQDQSDIETQGANCQDQRQDDPTDARNDKEEAQETGILDASFDQFERIQFKQDRPPLSLEFPDIFTIKKRFVHRKIAFHDSNDETMACRQEQTQGRHTFLQNGRLL